MAGVPEIKLPAPVQMLLSHMGVNTEKIAEAVTAINSLIASGAIEKLGAFVLAFREIDVEDFLQFREDIRVIRSILEHGENGGVQLD